jgi:rare lipoprotein A
MRPQFYRHVQRAAAAAGALALGVTIALAAANPQVSTAQSRVKRHRQRHHPVATPVRLRARLLHPNVLIGSDIAFIGKTTPSANRRRVAIEELTRGRWVAIAHTLTDRDGYFRERLWPRRLGQLALRVRAVGIPAARTTMAGRVAIVYHQVIASWYGPGGTTACGEQLGAATLGVANKTLPCGTKVTLRFGNRVLTVPVIDRGPFVPGRDYDLTYATKVALGAGDVSTIWASA